MNGAARHRNFLNAYYGTSRSFYDVTRKYYLFGRDRALDLLLEGSWSTLIEVGSGTGRNLRKLRQRRPSARFGGVDAADAMLEYARPRIPWAMLRHGFAEDARYESVLGCRPDRILFSYSLSMIEDKARALENARRSLAPSGRVFVVDFGDHARWPTWPRRAFRQWLERFHVAPLEEETLRTGSVRFDRGPLGYYVIASFAALA